MRARGRYEPIEKRPHFIPLKKGRIVMKMFLQYAVALFAATAACRAVAADDAYSWTADKEQSISAAGAEKASSSPLPQTDDGESSYFRCLQNSGIAVVGNVGFDTFQGISEGGYSSNFGAVAGVNSSVPLFGLSDYGFGWQTGLSYGVYDFEGRYEARPATSQQQFFVTTGFYRKAKDDERLSFGMVYDWMVNDAWGVGATTPTLGQWRAQAEWAFTESDAVGVRGAVRDRVAYENTSFLNRDYLFTTRSVSYADLFWHHEFESKADTFLWFGFTQSDRLDGDGSLYDWLIGASGEVPLNDRIALYANAQYMHASASAGTDGWGESGYNVSMGIAIYFGCAARDRSIHGTHGPYMPVANNSSFMVDESAQTYY
jgi:hypothetical protein